MALHEDIDSPLILSSSYDYENTKLVIDFPKDVKGKVIIDIGAGGSDSVFHLAKLGANAIAVDPRYKDIDDIIARCRQYIKGLSITMPFVTPDFEKALTNFERDFRQTKLGKYFPEYVQKLSFKDSFADFVFSIMTIDRYLLDDKLTIFNSLMEIVRVLKPGAKAEIYPWPNSDPTKRSHLTIPMQKQIDNAVEVVNFLSMMGHSIEEIVLPTRSTKLVITKKID